MSSAAERHAGEALRSLLHHPLRTLLAALTSAAAVAVVANVISLAQGFDRGADRFRPIANLYGSRCGCHDGRADRRRIFASRIVVGNIDGVGQTRCDLAHDRTLRPVAITAAAKHNMQTSPGVGAQRAKRIFQRIRFVGIIDEDRCAGTGPACEFEAASGSFQRPQRVDDQFLITACAKHESCCNQCV